jgi:hypothetical protein
MCGECALREVEPLAVSLVAALGNDPETLVMASNKGRASYYEKVFDLALELYEDGWRLLQPAEEAENAAQAD